MARIIDCFMAAYEADAINVRLSELDGIIDIHFAVQGTTTFRGVRREPINLPDRVVCKIVEIPVGDGSPWWRERFLRDASLTEATPIAPDAFFLVADADEIPHPDAVEQAVTEYDREGPRTLLIDYREWYANWRAPDGWQNAHIHQPVIGKFGDFVKIGGAHAARFSPFYRDDLRRAYKWPSCDATGWHLSSLGDATFMHDKIGAFSHAELDNPHDRDLERIEGYRRARKDFINRFDLEITADLPATIGRFPHLIAGSATT